MLGKNQYAARIYMSFQNGNQSLFALCRFLPDAASLFTSSLLPLINSLDHVRTTVIELCIEVKFQSESLAGGACRYFWHRGMVGLAQTSPTRQTTRLLSYKGYRW